MLRRNSSIKAAKARDDAEGPVSPRARKQRKVSKPTSAFVDGDDDGDHDDDGDANVDAAEEDKLREADDYAPAAGPTGAALPSAAPGGSADRDAGGLPGTAELGNVLSHVGAEAASQAAAVVPGEATHTFAVGKEQKPGGVEDKDVRALGVGVDMNGEVQEGSGPGGGDGTTGVVVPPGGTVLPGGPPAPTFLPSAPSLGPPALPARPSLISQEDDYD